MWSRGAVLVVTVLLVVAGVAPATSVGTAGISQMASETAVSVPVGVERAGGAEEPNTPRDAESNDTGSGDSTAEPAADDGRPTPTTANAETTADGGTTADDGTDDDPRGARTVGPDDAGGVSLELLADTDWLRTDFGRAESFAVSLPENASASMLVQFYRPESLLPVGVVVVEPGETVVLPVTASGASTVGVSNTTALPQTELESLPPEDTFYSFGWDETIGNDAGSGYNLPDGRYYFPASVDGSVRPVNPPASVSNSGLSSLAVGTATDDADSAPETQFLLVLPSAENLPEDDDAVVDALLAHANATQEPLVAAVDARPGVRVVQRFWLTNAVLVKVDEDVMTTSSLRDYPGVSAVVANQRVFTVQSAVGAPLSATEQVETSAAATTSATDPRATYGVRQVNAPAAWERYGTTGEGVTVAVLDSGIEPSHRDIDLHTTDATDATYPGGWAKFDGYGRQVVGAVPADSSSFSHGTHASGTVAGGDEGGVHIGVAPGVRLLHGQVTDGEAGTVSQVVAGIQWAVERDADVASVSIGAPFRVPPYVDAVRNAERAGTLVVAASGNDGPGVTSSPANVYDAVSVGATGPNEELLPFSSSGVVTREEWELALPPDDWPESYAVPTVVAPGGAVLSASAQGGYASLSGTSMSTPHVAGVAALVVAGAGREVTSEEVRAALVASARRPADLTPAEEVAYGAGVVDAVAAIEAIRAMDDDTGRVLDWNEVQSSSLAESETHRYSLATDGRSTRVVVARPDAGDGPFAVALLDERGRPSGLFDAGGESRRSVELAPGEAVTLRTVAAGTYTLAVSSSGGAGPYTAAHSVSPPLAGDPADTASQFDAALLGRGTELPGRLTAFDWADWYLYLGTGATERFVLSRPAEGGGDVTMELMRQPAGFVAETSVVVPPGSARVVEYDSAFGAAYVRVTSENSSREAGAYLLSYLDETELVAVPTGSRRGRIGTPPANASGYLR